MTHLDSGENETRKVLGSIGPLLFSLGFIYLVSWNHAFAFLEKMGAAWYIGNVSLLWMLSVSRFTFISYFMLILPTALCIVALERFKLKGRIILIGISVCLAPVLSLVEFSSISIAYFLRNELLPLATISGSSLVLTYISVKAYISKAIEVHFIVIGLALIVMIPTQRGALEAGISASKAYFPNGNAKILGDTTKYQVISASNGEVLLKEIGTKKFHIKNIDVIEYVGN